MTLCTSDDTPTHKYSSYKAVVVVVVESARTTSGKCAVLTWSCIRRRLTTYHRPAFRAFSRFEYTSTVVITQMMPAWQHAALFFHVSSANAPARRSHSAPSLSLSYPNRSPARIFTYLRRRNAHLLSSPNGCQKRWACHCPLSNRIGTE